MPNSFKPNIEDLTPVEKLIVSRVIEGSKKQHDAFVKAATRDPEDAAHARQLVEQTRKEHAEALAGKRGFYPSLKVRGKFLQLLLKRRIALAKDAIATMKAALDIPEAVVSFQDLIDHPELLTTLFDQPMNLQNGQKPIIFANGCIDSRVDMTELLSAQKGQVLVRREPAGKIKGIGESLAIAIEVAKVRKVVLVKHGNCSAIAECNEYIDKPEPEKFGKRLLWEMAQAKREVFDDVRDKGIAYYRDRLDIKNQDDPHLTKEELELAHKLQALEICTALRDMRYTRDIISQLDGGNEVTLVSIYMDLRTMNAYMLRLTGPNEDDWTMTRLTDHSKIPCAPSCECPQHTLSYKPTPRNVPAPV